MNKSEFDKLLTQLESLVCRGSYIYSMTLYKEFPVKWSNFIESYDYAGQQCVEGDSLNVDLSHN